MHKIQSFKTKSKLVIILTNIMRCLNPLINQNFYKLLQKKIIKTPKDMNRQFTKDKIQKERRKQ